MSYLVIARKFRPHSFLEVSGQEQVTRTLSNAIKRNRIAHAYLFAGPRGVGKTSIARIFAKCLNCQNGPTSDPCLTCTTCVEITRGSSMAVREIDGASHNSVDDVRDLIDSFRSLPPPGSRYKIYIIDEVHMLSIAAFNALLKSLEEPPPNTVFILATTEAHKIPETVISRCQRHDFRALSTEQVISRLQTIATQESIAADVEVLRMIARLSDGSMRDSQSLLDRVNSFCDGNITAVEAAKVLGVVDRSMMFRLSAAIIAHDAGLALDQLAGAFDCGIDPTVFMRDFVSHFREIMIVRFAGQKLSESLGLSVDDYTEMRRQALMIDELDLQDLVHLARDGADSAVRSTYPRYALEALIVRMASRQPMQSLEELLTKQTNSAPKAIASVQPKIERRQVVTESLQTNFTGGSSAETNLEWEKFVAFVLGEPGLRMLAEQLKRVSIHNFKAGELKAFGPEFTCNYLNKPEQRSKLVAQLNAFCNHSNWQVQVAIQDAQAHGQDGVGAVAARGSIHAEVERTKTIKRESKKQELVENPNLKNLQRLFPGSEVESITVHEE